MQFGPDPRQSDCSYYIFKTASLTYSLAEPIESQGTIAGGLRVGNLSRQGERVVNGQHRNTVNLFILLGDGTTACGHERSSWQYLMLNPTDQLARKSGGGFVLQFALVKILEIEP